MPERNLVSLVIRAIDDFNQILSFHELLQIALDESQPEEGGKESRTSLLLASYLSLSQPYFEEIEAGLEMIRQRIGTTPVNEESRA